MQIDAQIQKIQQAFDKCKPLVLYVIIACVLSTITVLLSVGTGANLASQILVNILSMMICSGLLYWLCTVNQTAAWVLLFVIVFLNLGFIYTTFMTAFKSLATTVVQN